jgi:ABC-type branched-subunit amino acid transport system substrate-binding protein
VSWKRIAAAAAALAIGSLSGRPAEPAAPHSLAATTAPHAWKLAFIGPLSGPLADSGKESLAGVRAALEVVAKQQPDGKKPELLELDDGDEVKKAEAAFESAKTKKCDVIVAAATGATVEAYVAKARKSELPLLLVGSCGPALPSIAPEEPVFWLGGWPVEHAVTISTFLAIPCQSFHPAVVAEDTARGKELAAALSRNLTGRFQFAGTVLVPPHGTPAADGLAKLKAAGADRLVLVGEPDLVDTTVAALDAAKWDVPLFVDDGMVSLAAHALYRVNASERLKGTFLLQGYPRFAQEAPPELVAAATPDPEGSKSVMARTLRAFTTTRLFFQAVAGWTKKPKLDEIVTALLGLQYGSEENDRPLLDETHRSARNAWLPWKIGTLGPEADVPTYFLDPDMGPALRVRSPSLYDATVPGTKVVWISYGDAYSKAARSIENDLKDLGLITYGYDGEMDRWVLDELMARALGKINRLFLKHEDGTFIPGVSFAISFTTVKPAELKESDYWRAVIAGDDSAAGGRAWPGEGRCEIYSTFMKRTIYLPKALKPPMRGEDKPYLSGKYVWGTSTEENLRIKLIRALIDGYAGSFALTGAHELGHIAGLGHDTESPRSIMNVAEGAGLAETSACWIPSHVETLEKSIGRYGVKHKK